MDRLVYGDIIAGIDYLVPVLGEEASYWPRIQHAVEEIGDVYIANSM